MNRAAQILVKQLQHYGHGDALWNPSPSDGEGLEIGDVGFIDTRGSFERCFNAAQNADGNLNKNRVPAGFNPVKITALHRKHGEQYSPTFLTGRSIKKTKVNIHANAAYVLIITTSSTDKFPNWYAGLLVLPTLVHDIRFRAVLNTLRG